MSACCAVGAECTVGDDGAAAYVVYGAGPTCWACYAVGAECTVGDDGTAVVVVYGAGKPTSICVTRICSVSAECTVDYSGAAAYVIHASAPIGCAYCCCAVGAECTVDYGGAAASVIHAGAFVIVRFSPRHGDPVQTGVCGGGVHAACDHGKELTVIRQCGVAPQYCFILPVVASVAYIGACRFRAGKATVEFRPFREGQGRGAEVFARCCPDLFFVW